MYVFHLKTNARPIRASAKGALAKEPLLRQKIVAIKNKNKLGLSCAKLRLSFAKLRLS